jgi:hypothetical protein
VNVGMLRAAKEELQRAGWCQGVYWKSPDGPCCILGAALRVSGLDPELSLMCDIQDVEDYVEKSLRAVLDMDRCVNLWNDEDERTEAEVLSALDRAIAYRAGLEELP